MHLEDRLFETPGKWTISRCTNKVCGLMWLNPIPIEDDLYLAYQDYYTHTFKISAKQSLFLKIKKAYQVDQFNFPEKNINPLHKWAGRLIANIDFFREPMDYPLVFFKNIPRGKFLELGAGSGETLKHFKDFGWDAEGLDFDPEAVKVCALKGLKVNEGDLHSQRFNSGSFDAIFSAHVMEHVAQPSELMRESIRILKANGLFVAITPNGKSVLHSVFKSDWRGLEPPRHLHIFTKDALLSAAKQAGFSYVEVLTSNFSAAGVFSASMRLKTRQKNSIFLRIASNLVRLLLTFYRRLHPNSGEELILIAKK
jgi:SAM-dependent methyltransferase